MKHTEMEQIEQAAREFADAHEALTGLVTELNHEIEDAKRVRQAAIRRRAAVAAEKRATLEALIKHAPELFSRPRTVVFHGVKLGLQKGKGGIDFDDATQVVELIQRHYAGEELRALLNVTTVPDKKALGKLTVTELKRLGCRVIDTGDEVVIKTADGEVEKTVKALLLDPAEITVLPAAA